MTVLRTALRELGYVEGRDFSIEARYADGQFGVLLPGADLPDALRVAERVRSAIAACHSLDMEGQELSFTVSIGVTKALANDDGHALVDRATTALHAAIHAGRNSTRTLPEVSLPVLVAAAGAPA